MRQAIRKHLDVLSRAGLIRGDRLGSERIWRVEPKQLDDARFYLDRISREWDDALGWLKRFVERST